MKRGKPILLLLITFVVMASTIDLNDLFPYEGLSAPAYITKDNTPTGNTVTNAGATLGRVLFYDKQLSLNGSISCSSCHQQEFAFGDPAPQSMGFEGGLTGRHSMRLVNSRYSEEVRFFWDERAATLELQSTAPIQDHLEMGFSGENGQPGFDSLIIRLSSLSYYPLLFEAAFGDSQINEPRVRRALAQFIRSIQSFDSAFDTGLAQTGNVAQPFPNYTMQQNMGKMLFLNPPPMGAGCAGCHRPPEFDIDPASLNNGVIGVAGSPGAADLTNTRSPSLRDVVNQNGVPNGPFMHDGSLPTLLAVIDHYNLILPNPANTNLDPRLNGIPGSNQGQNLNLNQNQKTALVAFLGTLTGSSIYSSSQWSNPFEENGEITVIPLGTVGIDNTRKDDFFKVYPNPASDILNLDLQSAAAMVRIVDLSGKVVHSGNYSGLQSLYVGNLPAGMYVVTATAEDGTTNIRKVMKR
jgi:cytochrome c peroxidase